MFFILNFIVFTLSYFNRDLDTTTTTTVAPTDAEEVTEDTIDEYGEEPDAVEATVLQTTTTT